MRRTKPEQTRKYVSTKTVSEITSIPEGTLQNLRYRRAGIPYHKFEGRVLYSLEDVDRFMRDCRVDPSELRDREEEEDDEGLEPEELEPHPRRR